MSVEAKIEAFQDDADAVLLVDGDGRVGYANPACEHLYGLADDEIRGRALDELLRGGKHALPWAERIGRARDHGSWSTLERHHAASGVTVWVNASLERAGDGELILRARRAGGRQVAQHTRDMVALLSDAMAAGGIGIWFDDSVTQQLDWSARTRAIYRHGPSDPVTHETLFAALHPDDRAGFAAEVQEILTRGEDRFAFQFRVGEGDDDAAHVEAFGTVLRNDDGTMLLGIGGVRDASELVRARQRVAELEEQLEQAQKVDVAGRLASGVAHDFNNLLTGILGFAEMLRMSELTPTQQSDLAEIRSAVERATDLTRQLLSFVRRQPMSRKRIAIDEVIAGTCRLMRRIVPETVTIEHRAGSVGAVVDADVAQLHQVLSNLVINASHAMPEGGVIALRSRRAVVDRDGERAAGPYAVVDVIDTGGGIPREVRHRIFEPFFTTKDVGRGTGLGLSVVQSIVDRHRGFVDVATELGRGSTFSIFLPEATAAIDAEAAAGPAPRIAGGRCTVLVVEDEHMVRLVTRRILEAEGCRVLEAVDGRDALALVDAGTRFDVLLTDVIMPRMTGPALVGRLRESMPDLRVLYVSGYPAELLESRFAVDTRTDLLMKPYTRAELLAAVAQLLPRP